MEILSKLTPVELFLSATVGITVVLGFLFKKGYISLADSKRKEDGPVTQREFTEAMQTLRVRMDEIGREARQAKISADSASNSLQSIANMIQASMESLGSRFDRAIDRLDIAVDKMVVKLDNHETRISRGEATIEVRGEAAESMAKRVGRLEDRD